jgi:hypothetical protein
MSSFLLDKLFMPALDSYDADVSDVTEFFVCKSRVVNLNDVHCLWYELSARTGTNALTQVSKLAWISTGKSSKTSTQCYFGKRRRQALGNLFCARTLRKTTSVLRLHQRIAVPFKIAFAFGTIT